MFRPLASLLASAVRRIGAEQYLEAQAVLTAANQALARIEHAHSARAYRYARGRLWVAVAHPGVAELIQGQRGTLLDELRAAFPRLPFTGLQFTTRR
ncbi:MAG: DUF721 domain-containing protein [Candidatus Kerfeldbacteria bacterium]|nr:DUF721 domain-containing protein [Candidatus Kerfeldbacteria bacterium]